MTGQNVTTDLGNSGDNAGDNRSVAHERNGGAAAERQLAVTPIPSSIVKAICQVQSSIEAVAKTQYNKQGNYKFASADDIYAAVARKFGECGLMIYPLEMAPPEIKRVEKTDKDGELKVSQWGQFHFGYVLATEEATWFDPRSSRTIFIQILGPQTFNAAESYCQKQYLRALLKLPTGDMDLDSMPQGETEEDQVSASSPRAKKSSYRAKKDGDDVPYNELRGAISSADGPAHLAQIVKGNWSFIQALPDRWRVIVDDEIKDKYAEFETLDAAE